MNRVNVSLICKRYQEQGLDEFVRNKYTSYRQALAEDQENDIQKRFDKAAEAGEGDTAMEIKTPFDEMRGKDPRSGDIGPVWHRWD